MPWSKVWLLLCRFHHISLYCSRHLLYRLVSQPEEKGKNKEKYNLHPLAQRNWVKIFSAEFYLNRPNNDERSVRNSLTPLRKVCLSLRRFSRNPGLLADNFVKNYSRAPLLRINWDSEPSGYAENPDNLLFLWK